MSYSQVAAKEVRRDGPRYGMIQLNGHASLDKLDTRRSIRVNMARDQRIDVQQFYTSITEQARAMPISKTRGSNGNLSITFPTTSPSLAKPG